MIFFRFGIVLFIIMIFLPSSQKEKAEVYGSIQGAIHRVETFCDRNESLCNIARATAGKISIAAHMIRDAVWHSEEMPDAAAQERDDQPAARTPAAKRYGRGDGGVVEKHPRRSYSSYRSQSTLTPHDLSVPWRGPGQS